MPLTAEEMRALWADPNFQSLSREEQNAEIWNLHEPYRDHPDRRAFLEEQGPADVELTTTSVGRGFRQGLAEGLARLAEGTANVITGFEEPEAGPVSSRSALQQIADPLRSFASRKRREARIARQADPGQDWAELGGELVGGLLPGAAGITAGAAALTGAGVAGPAVAGGAAAAAYMGLEGAAEGPVGAAKGLAEGAILGGAFRATQGLSRIPRGAAMGGAALATDVGFRPESTPLQRAINVGTVAVPSMIPRAVSPRATRSPRGTAEPQGAPKVEADGAGAPSASRATEVEVANPPRANDGKAPHAQPGELPPIEGAPLDMHALFEALRSGQPVPDMAGPLNMRHIHEREGIRKTIAAAAAQLPLDDVKGFVPRAETEKLGRMLNLSLDDMAAVSRRFEENPALAYGSRLVLNETGADLTMTMAKIAEAQAAGRGISGELTEEFLERSLRIAAVAENLTGIAASAGRTLNIFGHKATMSDARRAKMIKRLVDDMGGAENIENFQKALLEFDSVDQMLRAAMKTPYLKSMLDKGQEFFLNSLLSSLRTIETNVVSNALFAGVVRPIENVLAATAGAVFRPGADDRVYFRDVAARLTGMVQGIPDFMHAFKNAHKHEWGGGLTESALLDQVGGTRGPKIGGLKGKIIRTPQRILTSTDEAFKAWIRVQARNENAMRQAIIDSKRPSGHRYALGEGETIATRYDQYRRSPTSAMTQDIERQARQLTFTTKPGDVGRNIQNAINRIPGGRFLVPFINTPVNIAKEGLRRTPLGLLAPSVLKEFKKGGAARDLALTQIGLGSAAFTTAYMMADQDLITGAAPREPRARAQFFLEGKKPFALRVGSDEKGNDRWVQYLRIEPIATTLGMAATLAAFKKAVDETDVEGMEKFGQYAIAGMLSTTENMLNKTYFQGLSDAFLAVNDPERYGGQLLRSWTSAWIPNIIADVARAQNPELRIKDSMEEAFAARLPKIDGLDFFLSREDAPKRYDLLGNVATIGESEGHPGSPIFSSKASTDPVVEVMRMVGTEVQGPSRRLNLAVPGRSASGRSFPDEKRVTLPKEQWEWYQRESGKQARRVIVKELQRQGILDSDGKIADRDALERELQDEAHRAALKAGIEGVFSRSKQQARNLLKQGIYKGMGLQ